MPAVLVRANYADIIKDVKLRIFHKKTATVRWLFLKIFMVIRKDVIKSFSGDG